MRLSSLRGHDSFALLGPGFGGGRPVLLEGLRQDGRARLVFAPYEGAAQAFDAATENAGDIDIDVEPVEPSIRVEAGDHARDVDTIRAAIAAGDVYQVNLTVRAHLDGVDGAQLFAAMCARGMPTYAAWVRLPTGLELCSASPELLFEMEGGRIRSQPMKGTARAGATGELSTSAKDAAELAMITDLVRNDLAPLCVPRSVRVVHARRFIELPYAVQAVSDVEGELIAGATVHDALRALHPGGSVTGAPKIAAMEMIARLEPTPRGAYCGALAFTSGGRTTASLLIRTATRAGASWVYGVGGGIVHDSVAAREREEIDVKLGALRCGSRR